MSDGEELEVLAIIPARGGSKRLPGKNLRLLNGKPLIAYSIETALQCASVNKVIVSTDDQEIANAAEQFGAEVPFLRPAEFAEDTTPDHPVFLHALNWLKEHENYIPELVLNLRPTAPFRTMDVIQGVIAKWRSAGVDSVRSMCRAESVHHPYWMFKEEGGLASPVIAGKSTNEYYQSQLLPPVYHLNGLVDAMSANVIMSGGHLYGRSMAIYETPRAISLDIDTMDDFELAEFMIQKTN